MNRWIPTTIGTLVVAGVAAWFFLTFEWVEEDFTRWSEEAQSNQFLAAGRILEELGYTVETVDQFDPSAPLPVTGATLIMPVPGGIGDAEGAAEALRDWASRGGNLILWLPDFLPPSSESFVQAFEMRVDEPGDFVSYDVEHEGDWTFPALDYLYRRIVYEGDAVPVGRFSDAYGNAVITVPIGEGIVTVLADREPLYNYWLDEDDHAALLVGLVSLHDGLPAVTLVREFRAASLLALLWRHFSFVFIAGGVALAGWLWSRTRRFGPLLVESHTAPPSLTGHTDALGRFLWRKGRGKALVLPAREAVLERLSQHRPALARAGVDAQVSALAELTGQSPDTIRAALFGPVTGGDQFIRTMQQIQTIRNAL